MNTTETQLKKSALVMKVLGWVFILGALPLGLLFPNGFLWGGVPLNFPVICFTHGPSPLDGLHPYLIMLLLVYLAWAVLLIRGAKDPKANAALFDFGILANLLHGLSMIPMAFIYPNERAHLYMDIPMLFAMCLILWHWHPSRVVN